MSLRDGPPRTQERGAFPTFLVVGAPYSGARTLSAVLRRFPTIHLPPTESAFFGRRFDRGSRWYQDRFHPPPETRILGDLSTAALASDTDNAIVAARIDGFLPGARLVAVLREPVGRALAHHRALILEGKIPAEVPLEDHFERRDDDGDPHSIVSNGFYGQHLLPFVQRFGERLQLVDRRELMRRPTTVVVNVARHIGAAITKDPGVASEARGSDEPELDVSEDTRHALAKHFEDDLEVLYRTTGFRFTDPENLTDRTDPTGDP